VSACVTLRSIPIETLQPATLTFEGARTVISINAPQTLFSDAITNNSTAVNIQPDSLITNIIRSLRQIWEEAVGFENAQFTEKITASDSISEDFSNYDLTIQLENLRINNAYYGQQYGFFEWEAYLYAHYTTKWLIYNNEGALIDEYTDFDLVIWSSGIHANKEDAVAGLPRVNDAWWDLGIAVARSYSARIMPQWQTEMRYIYMINKFPELSQTAYRAMQNDSYARAFDVWENMLFSCRKKGQKKTKSQITYNMAIASEFNNNLEQAIFWTRRSLNLKFNNRTFNYLNILNVREQQRIKLDEQINN